MKELDVMSDEKGIHMLDLSTEWGQHAEQRLRSDKVAWLTTVGSDGRPYTVPVWFLWEGNSVLLFSQPNKQKVRNLRKNERITLALDDTKGGDDVVIVEGRAELLENSDLSAKVPEYIEKYRAKMQELGYTPETYAGEFSLGIRVTPTKIRNWA